MKLRKNYLIALTAPLFAALSFLPAQAQTRPAAKQNQQLALAMAPTHTAPVRRETLSGIDLYPEKRNKENFFMLSFQQDMEEDGMLHFTNASGKVLYTKPIPAGDHSLAPPIDLGILKAGIYMVEVKTPTTVYWKKLRVRL